MIQVRLSMNPNDLMVIIHSPCLLLPTIAGSYIPHWILAAIAKTLPYSYQITQDHR